MEPTLPSPDGLPSAGRPDDGVSPRSGAGLTRAVPLEAPKEPVADLPWTYEDDRLVLLPRDPSTLYAYWDLHPETIRRAMEGWSSATALLRLVTGADGDGSVRDLDIDLGWRGFYLYDCEPDRDYRVELIMRGPGGQQRRLARTLSIVRLSPDRPTSQVDDRFATLNVHERLPAGGITGDRDRAGAGLHERTFALSGGGESALHEGENSSARRVVKGVSLRGWSGTVRK